MLQSDKLTTGERHCVMMSETELQRLAVFAIVAAMEQEEKRKMAPGMARI